VELDAIDIRILDKLQNDASVSSAELASEVGLSQSPCWRRVSILEAGGIIKKRVTLLARSKLGLGALVYVDVKLADHGGTTLPALRKLCDSSPEILQCSMLVGDVDYVLVVATRDIEAYSEFLRTRLSKVPGIREITSRIVLEEIKNTSALPLDYAVKR
jgi:Lrp/AsnC family transcriptional regulator